MCNVMLRVKLHLLWGQWNPSILTHHHSIVFTEFPRTYILAIILMKKMSRICLLLYSQVTIKWSKMTKFSTLVIGYKTLALYQSKCLQSVLLCTSITTFYGGWIRTSNIFFPKFLSQGLEILSQDLEIGSPNLEIIMSGSRDRMSGSFILLSYLFY